MIVHNQVTGVTELLTPLVAAPEFSDSIPF